MSVSQLHHLTPSRSTARGAGRRVPRRVHWGRLAVAAVIGTVLCGCSGTTRDQGTTVQSTAGSTAAVPGSTGTSSLAASTSMPPSGSSAPPVSSPATSGAPTGTVVPFRTVTPGSAVGKRIGLVAPTGSDPFGKAVTDSIIAQVKAAGAALISCDPGANPTLVLDCARRMATEHVDGWIAVQSGDLGQALCDVGPKDVPLIAIAAPPVSCQTGGVGADDEQAGFLVGQELGRVPRNRSACEHAAIIIVADAAAGTVSAQRVTGIQAGFAAQCPGPTANIRILDAGTQDRAYSAFSTALTKLPEDADILVAAVNDGAALGVLAATPDARSAHVVVAAIGADQRARCEMVANSQWIGDAALFPDRYGEVAVPALLDAMDGQRIPGAMYVRSTFVTSAVLGDFYDVGDCPAK